MRTGPSGNGEVGEEDLRDASTGVTATDTEDELWAALHLKLHELLGATSILYGFAHSRHAFRRVGVTPCLTIRHSHPSDYVARFADESFLDDDLCTFVLWQSDGPFLWADLETTVAATPAQLERARIDREMGMDVGVSVGFRFAGGQGVAGIGIAARWMPADAFERRWRAHEDEVMDRLRAFEPLMRRRMIERRLRLTRRQSDVLRLSIAGMIGKEIAEELGLSEGRVERLFREIRDRLEAETTVEAAVKAIAFDLV